MGFSLAKIASLALRILTFGITIPVGVILAAGLWLHMDKGSAVRQAVQSAVTELVAGAELEAARARASAAEAITAELRNRNKALAAANAAFETDLETAERELETANEDLEYLAAQPVSDSCTVDDGLFERLRNQ